MVLSSPLTTVLILQHGASWRRRSLIEDAKFDTVTNAEYERQERPKSISESEDDVFTTPVANGDASHMIIESEIPEERRKCTLMFTLKETSLLSKVFRNFEVRTKLK